VAHDPSRRTLATRLAFALSVLPFVLTACVSTDDARTQQLLNQRGFGARYVGDSNEQYYLGVGDEISIQDAQHPEFNGILKVRPDGVIGQQYAGEIFVAGLTIPDVEETLTRRFREFNTTAQISVQLVASTSKWYYVDGEVQIPGRKPFEGDTTLFTAVFESSPTILADQDSVRLIRADPYHPLTVEFDYDDMLEGGWAKSNVEIRENDIVFVPPNFFGYLTIYTQKLFAPLQVVVFSVLGFDRLIYAAQTFGNTSRFVGGRGRVRYGGLFSYALPASRPALAMQVAPLDAAMFGE
jgi:protein involved in polysaccharide export with SLBB domain